jgi:cytoskeleton protein RodZ
MNAAVEPETPAVKTGPGALLKAARVERRFDLDKVAAQLHLSRDMVVALEKDEFGALPGPVFVQGYLRNYARILGLAVNPILDAYAVAMPANAAPPALSGKRNTSTEVASNHYMVRLVTWLIVIVLAALLAIWWHGRLDWSEPVPSVGGEQVNGSPGSEGTVEVLREYKQRGSNGSNGSKSMPLGSSESLPAEIEPSPAVTEDMSSSLTAPSVGIADEPPVTTVAEGAVPVPAAAAGLDPPSTEVPLGQAAANTQPPGVVFEFADASWVDIRDSEGKNKIIGLMSKGTRRVAEGKPPFTIVLGNSPVVKVTVNGRPYDLKPHSQGNVARFTLDVPTNDGE